MMKKSVFYFPIWGESYINSFSKFALKCLEENLKKSDYNFLNTSKIEIWTFKKDIYQACKGSDAIIVLTEWEEYKNINWEKIASNMSIPSWVFDTRNILKRDSIEKNGIKYWCLGDGFQNE